MSEESLGLDIGASTIKVVGLRRVNKGFEVIAHGIAPNPVGISLPESPDDRTRLLTTIQNLLKSLRIESKKVRVGLPESLVFTKVIQIPLLTDAELSSAIRWEAEQHIPIPVEDIHLDYTVLSRPNREAREGTMTVLLVAARKSTVNTVVDLIEATTLELEMVDTNVLSAVRALIVPEDLPTLLIHSGATSTDFAVTSDKKISLTHSTPIGGISLTRAVELELALSATQAEQYKRAYGLSENLLEGKVRHALLGTFMSILEDAKKALNSYDSTKTGKKVQRVILSGGSALMPGIATEIASNLGVSEVLLGNPFTGISARKGVALPTEQTVYSVAVGLARGDGKHE